MKGRIARAIYDVENRWIAGNFPPDWKPRPFEELQAHEQRLHYDYADAVLKAMREPTEGMCRAGVDTGEVSNNEFYVRPSHMLGIWQAMIDAALTHTP
jgi:hypothetical protein